MTAKVANSQTTTGAYERWVLAGWVMAIALPMAMQTLWALVRVATPHAHTSTSLIGGVGCAIVAVNVLALVRRGRTTKIEWWMTLIGGIVGFALPDATVSRIVFAAGMALLSWSNHRCLVYLHQQLPAGLDGLARRKRWAARGWLVLAAGSVIVTARIGGFLGDVERKDLSLMPGVEFLERHACSTAYVHAAVLTRNGQPNPYHVAHVPDIEIRDDQSMIQVLPDDLAIDVGPLTLDSYAYPPTFLLLPRALLGITDNYLRLRTIWFGLCGLVSLLATVVVAFHIGGRAGSRAVTWIPAVWISLPWLVCLHMGNVHVALVAVALLGMIAFAHDRNALGGGLLAFVTLAKISPGVLGAYLLVRRRWGAVIWTVVWSIVLLIASLVLIGPEVTASFVDYELPRLASGRAFDFLLDRRDAVLSNYSIFAVPFKLAVLGLVEDPWNQAPLWSWAYSLGVLALAFYAGARVGLSRLCEVSIWLALLGLASLRSPAAPGYVFVAWTWVLVLLGAGTTKRRTIALICLAWFLTSFEPPPAAHAGLYLLSLVRQTFAIGLMVWIAMRYRGGETD